MDSEFPFGYNRDRFARRRIASEINRFGDREGGSRKAADFKGVLVYRAVDNEGQVIDVFVSPKRDIAAATKFFAGALAANGCPVPVGGADCYRAALPDPMLLEVVTDKAAALANVIEKLLPMVHHNTEQYANNRVECDHGRLKARLRPMRGLKTDRGARVAIRGHMFIQNLRRGHYELGTESASSHLRVAAAFDEPTRQLIL